MPDYKTMYFDLFNLVTDAIEILRKAPRKAEENFVNSYENEEEKVQKAE